MTISSAFESLSLKLLHIESYNFVVHHILSDVLQQSTSYLWAHPDTEITDDQFLQISEMIDRAATGEPLAYILGYVDFYDLRFKVDSRVLIPRPESEQLVELVLDHCRNSKLESIPSTIIDVGAGSGCIGLTLAKHLPQAQVYALDISTEALKVARSNARLLSIPNVTFIQGDLLQPLAGFLEPASVDVVVANLPYISDAEFDQLDQNVRNFEPALALRSGDDPDRLNRQLTTQVPRFLKPNGYFAYETTNGRIVVPKLQ